MHDAFVPLAEYLRVPIAAQAEAPPAEQIVVEIPPSLEGDALEETLAEVRRFRAALADALDLRIERLLADVAAGVLARELRIAPADIGAIVARELALAGGAPVKICAHPGDCEALQTFGDTVVPDSSLRRGDVRFELRSGTIVATLGCRLERALVAAMQP